MDIPDPSSQRGMRIHLLDGNIGIFDIRRIGEELQQSGKEKNSQQGGSHTPQAETQGKAQCFLWESPRVDVDKKTGYEIPDRFLMTVSHATDLVMLKSIRSGMNRNSQCGIVLLQTFAVIAHENSLPDR